MLFIFKYLLRKQIHNMIVTANSLYTQQSVSLYINTEILQSYVVQEKSAFSNICLLFLKDEKRFFKCG